jgi:hypothetical protein
MTRGAVAVPGDVRDVWLEIWAANERMNQLILERLDTRAWRAKLPGRTGRTIAAIFAHVHNIRRKWKGVGCINGGRAGVLRRLQTKS